MKGKYLFMFLLIAIFSIGAVSAADNSTDTTADIVITDDSYSTYFDQYGSILENSTISDGDTLKISNVTNKNFIIDKQLNIGPDGENAIAVNSSFKFVNGSSGSSIVALTINNNGVTPVEITDTDHVAVTDNKINVVSGQDTNVYAILIDNANELNVLDNIITYVGQTNATTINNAIRGTDSKKSVIEGNTLNITIPSCEVQWLPPNWEQVVMSEGIFFDNCDELVFSENSVSLAYNTIAGSYDTIYAIHTKNSDNISIGNNNISAKGHTYIYGILINGENFTISENNIAIESDEYYANGIDVEGIAKGAVNNNVIDVAAPVLTYGIYSAMSNGDVNVNYTGNVITATSDIVYGMELGGNSEHIMDGKITANGNYTIGIASKASDVFVNNTSISVFGENKGNTSVWESITPETAGIKTIAGGMFVYFSEITSTGSGVNIANTDFILTSTIVDVEVSDDVNSYGIYVDNSSVIISDVDLSYVGNTNGTYINKALQLIDCEDAAIFDNDFDIEIVSCDTQWGPAPDYARIVVSGGIAADNATGLLFDNNNVNLKFSNATGFYDTIYVLDVINTDNAVISNNTIYGQGNNYIYGILISGQNFSIADNYIDIESESYYANGIDIEGPASGIVENNTFMLESPVLAYPIYAGMNYAPVSADYINNTIFADAYAVYGIELDGQNQKIVGNTITATGNYTIGIATASDNITISDNLITLDAANEGNVSIWESVPPQTIGIIVTKGHADIDSNNIFDNGEYAVDITNTDSTVTNNYLEASELLGDYSVKANNSAAVVKNNTPYEFAILTGEDIVMYYKDGTRYSVKLTDANGTALANKSIEITINGVSYKRNTDANGTASIPLNLNSGEYSVKAVFEELPQYTIETVVNTIEIKSTVVADDLEKMYRNATQFKATLTDKEGKALAAGQIVSFNINGVYYNRTTDANGVAQLNINLNPGEYVITTINPVTGEMAANTVTVYSTIVDNEDLVKLYRNASQYSVKILDDQGNAVGAGKVVTFNINGVLYNRTTDANGTAQLNINLQPGDYIITATYNGCSVSNKIEVLPVLSADDLNKTYGTADQFKATLVDGEGQPYANQNVTFNINGVLYTRLTDSEGVAALNINLMPGEYIITSSYNGANIANKVTVKEV